MVTHQLQVERRTAKERWPEIDILPLSHADQQYPYLSPIARARDPAILTKAIITYVRPILEYYTSVWSSHAVSNINKIASCQRWFTKRIKGMSSMQYSERLACLNLEFLQIRRLRCDLLICYKIIHNEITILSDDFLLFSDFTRTRGHCYKLFNRIKSAKVSLCRNFQRRSCSSCSGTIPLSNGVGYRCRR